MTLEYPIVSQDAAGVVSRALPTRTPTTHTHGNITNAGAIGTTADLILGTGTAGAIETRTVSQVRTLLGLATDSDVVFNGLTITETNPNVTPFSLSGYSLTGANAQSMVSLDGTWNTTGTPTAIDLNITDTASNANSLLLALRVGGTNRTSISKAGFIFPGNNSGNGSIGGGTIGGGFGEGLLIGNPVSVFAAIGSGYFGVAGAVRFGFTAAGASNGVIDSGWQRDGAGIIHQRNGTNGQIARWAKTWASATNNELFEIDCAGNATTFDIAVCSGSAGGTNRGLRFGSKFAGEAFSSWLSFDNAGLATFSSAVLATAFTPISANARLDTNGINCGSATTFGISSATNPNAAARDVQLGRNATGPAWSARADGGIEVRNLANTAFAPLSCSDLTLVPSASRTLSTNGQFTIEMTSNTAGNLVYRGSDGTTRRSTIPFSYSLPTADGTNGQVLQTNGAGAVSFGSVQKTITSGTAAPSGGDDGDIYLQYV